MNMGVGTAMWDAEVSDTVGVASHVFASASRFSDAFNLGLTKVSLATQLWKLSSSLSGLVEKIHTGADKPPTSGSASAKASTKEQIESALRTLEYLHETTRRLYCKCESLRFTNSSMMAGSLRAINCRTEQLMDVIDWLRCYLGHSPSEIESVFADARKKLESGEVYDLADLR